MGRHPGTYPCKVGVRIGEMAAIDQDALRFCFEAIIHDTDLESLELGIEVCPRRHRCQECGREFIVRDYDSPVSAMREPGNRHASAEMNWSWLIWRWKNMERVPLQRKVLSENDRIAG